LFNWDLKLLAKRPEEKLPFYFELLLEERLEDKKKAIKGSKSNSFARKGKPLELGAT
jgi:hypothetical protein